MPFSAALRLDVAPVQLVGNGCQRLAIDEGVKDAGDGGGIVGR